MYWNKINGSELEPHLAICVFDFAVNSGVNRALRYLTLTHDWNKYLDLREEFLRRIGTASQAKFLKGWLNRTQSLRDYLNSF